MLEFCPRCGSRFVPTQAMNEGPSCNTFLNTYVPQSHQAAFHSDSHTFVGNFGGYGSGKTLTSREEIYKHMFITPHGTTLIGANVGSQYEQTIKREIEADMPMAFIKSISAQKSYFDLINGHRIMYRPYDDPDKLRSYNLTQFLILEASEVKPQSFIQLKTRLRNMAATTQVMDENGQPVFRKAKNGVDVPEIAHNWQRIQPFSWVDQVRSAPGQLGYSETWGSCGRI